MASATSAAALRVGRPTKEAAQPLPAPDSDFHQLVDVLTREERVEAQHDKVESAAGSR